ncbi:delta-lactam-biosynthetic de-N-acetylase [Pseudogracilibacillus sp. SO30301A]|uniref:delta-lactam-biosynthetic de-N-acetylase n=1 Tax=Pseudogracilibacillus sp. SO30301A TaxID=3098291 RepID=UPI00300DFE00
MKRKYGLSFSIVLMLFFIMPNTVHGYGWGYKKNYDNKLPELGKFGEILKGHDAIYADLTTGDKEIYFTFDNGYEQGYTEEVLEVLKKHQVPATFFVTGHYVKTEPDLVKRMVDEGHIIGNHSYNHPDFTTMTKEQIKEELDKLEKAVANVSGQKQTMYLRPPRGTFNENTLKWATEFGYVHVFWSLAFKDWETNNQKGWKYSYDQIMTQIHPGAILLLHTVSEDNAKALDKVITQLKKDGYTCKSLDDLMKKQLVPEGISL